jgi:hypothetical protein
LNLGDQIHQKPQPPVLGEMLKQHEQWLLGLEYCLQVKNLWERMLLKFLHPCHQENIRID